MKEQDEIKLFERISRKTPKFFRRISWLGASLTAIGGAIIFSPVVLPAALITAAGYISTIGAVAIAVAETAVEFDEIK